MPHPTPPSDAVPARADRPLPNPLWLGAALMLAGLLSPWVELRPNRLVDGELLRPGGWVWPGLILVVGLATLFARRPAWSAALANVALAGGVALFGVLARLALTDLPPSARSGAAVGVWLWLLGSGVALWGAAYAHRERTARGRPTDLLLSWAWLPAVLLLAVTGGLRSWSVWQEGVVEGPRLAQEVVTHVRLVLTALGFATLLGVPLAVWASRRERLGAVTLGVANAVQTLPSLALLGLLIAPLAALADAVPALRAAGVAGIGTTPALVALTLYALLPVLQNGVVALRGVDAGVMDAARGMGMTDTQRLWRVQLPLALPVWLAGLRQATVLLIGVTSVAALIGAGGLGVYVFRGLGASATDLILLGALPACLLALVADALWRGLAWLLTRRTGPLRVEGTP